MLHEVWYAVRRLRARLAHTLVVIAVFAVGTGSAMTVLRVANAVLLQPLPYRDPDRLVRLSMHMPILPNAELSFSEVGFRWLEARTHSFGDLAAFRTTGVNLTWQDQPRRTISTRVTGNFFSLLGLPPRLGRGFERGDEAAGKPPMLVLSDRFWRDAFAADPSVIGRTVRLDGMPATIIGVADARMRFPSAAVDYWTQMEMSPAGEKPYNLGIEAIARLSPGVGAPAANAEATEAIRQYTREYPGPHGTRDMNVSGFHTGIRSLRDDLVGGLRPTLVLLGVAVLFVLGLTCVNVATLELVRSSGRRSELAIRAALGAGHGRLIAGALAEGLLQASAGTVVGLALSAMAVEVLRALLPQAIGGEAMNGLGPWMLGGVLATVVLCTVAATAFPVAAALGRDVVAGLRDRAGGGGRRLTVIRRALILVQITAACILVDGALLMNITIRETQRIQLGFDPEGVLVFRLSLPPATYRERADVVGAYRDILARLGAIPGVASAGLSNTIPLGAEQQGGLFGIEGRIFKADGSDPQADYRIVSAGYLPTMGLRMVEGRGFGESDTYANGTPVIVSETLARQYFSGGSPVGQRIRTGPYAPWMTIVGVVADARNRSLILPPRPEMYVPYGSPRSPMGITRDMFVVLRGTESVAAIRAAAERVLRQTNPDLPVYGMQRFTDVIDASQVREVTTARTLAGFAVVALALAVAGTYAMLMFAVVQRRRELALRQAIGATSANMVSMIVGETGRLFAVGAATGLLGTILASRLLSAFLFQVTPLDPRVAIGTLAVLCLAGVVATVIPARRAGAIDPMLVLRE